MSNIDAALARLACEPGPPELAGIESRVLARVAARPASRSGFGAETIAIGMALAMGMVAAGVPAEPATAESVLSPLGDHSPLAPSTLLASQP